MNIVELVEKTMGCELYDAEKEYVSAIAYGRKILFPRCNAKTRHKLLFLVTIVVMNSIQGGDVE